MGHKVETRLYIYLYLYTFFLNTKESIINNFEDNNNFDANTC